MNKTEKKTNDKMKIRILVAGPAATGKTAIVERYLHNKFRKDYIMTMGGEIYVHPLRIDGKEIDLIINDLPGEERFRVARESFYDGAAGALVIFDLTRYTTFNPAIFERIKELWGAAGKIPLIIVGNKKDLAELGYLSVKKGDILDYCNKIPCEYIETSAQDGTGIEEAFNLLVRKILRTSNE